jgi:hypothetical protein
MAPRKLPDLKGQLTSNHAKSPANSFASGIWRLCLSSMRLLCSFWPTQTTLVKLYEQLGMRRNGNDGLRSDL